MDSNLRLLATDVEGASKMTSLSKPTLRLYIRSGHLPVTRCGRKVLIPVAALERLILEGAPTRLELSKP
jgi:excisionase family DNA binding protein